MLPGMARSDVLILIIKGRRRRRIMCVYREDPEGPEDPFAPENPETWLIVEEQQRREEKEK